MKKDVNFTLLKLIAFLMVAIAVTSVYYQYTYHTLRLDFDEASSALEVTSEGLFEKESALEQRQQQLNTSIEREAGLTTKYVAEKTEKERLTDELAETKKELSLRIKQNKELQDDNERLENEKDALEVDKAALEKDKAILGSIINALENEIDSLKDIIASGNFS